MRRLKYCAWTVSYKVITNFIIAALLTANVVAQELITEEQLFSDIPVVLSASRLPQPINEAPAAMTIIDQQMIEASGARNLVDIFRLVPGFVTANWNGHRAIVAPYGMADAFPRRMQILVDGRSVYKPDFGGVTWSDLPLALEDIEKIEVVRGPNAVTFGANSYLGVINIITKTAAAIRGTHIKYTTGRQNTSDTLLQYGSAGKDLDYRLTVSHQNDTGFADINDSRKSSFMNGRLDYRASNNDTINFRLGASTGDLGTGNPADFTDLPRDEKITSHFQQIHWTHLSETSSEFTLQYFHNYHESDDSYLVDLNPAVTNVLVDYDIASERHDIEFQHTLGFDDYLRLIWGFSGRQDSVTAERIFNTASEVKNDLWQTFINTEWRLNDSLLIHAGVMLEDTTITEKELSPRIAINYHITPGHTIRASYSEATRNPTLIEEKSEWRICALGVDPTCTTPNTYLVVSRASGGLLPEKISTRDISYMANITNDLYFDIRFSRSDIDHLIDWEHINVADNFIPPANVLDWVTRNVTDSLNTVELQASYSPSDNDRLLLSFAHLDFESGLYKDNDIRDYTRSVPKKVGSLLVMHDFQDGFKGSAGYYFLDKIKHLDSVGLGNAKLDERKQLDIRLSRQFSISGSEAEISGVIQNVLGDYDEYHNGSIVSTRYYLNFDLTFN